MRKLLILPPLLLTGCSSVRSQLPAPFAPPPPAIVKPKPAPPPVYRTPDGLKITPVDIPLDENARILGIHKWHFTVTPPPLTKFLQQRLEWHLPGKKPQSLGSSAGSINNLNTLNMVVAVQEIDDSATRGKKLRVYIGDENGGTTSIVDNPLKQGDNEISQAISYRQDFQKDGSCVLLEVGNRTPDPHNPKLIVKFKALKNDSGMDLGS